eukprot:750985-Hanusia_phi.AAC.7
MPSLTSLTRAIRYVDHGTEEMRSILPGLPFSDVFSSRTQKISRSICDPFNFNRTLLIPDLLERCIKKVENAIQTELLQKCESVVRSCQLQRGSSIEKIQSLQAQLFKVRSELRGELQALFDVKTRSDAVFFQFTSRSQEALGHQKFLKEKGGVMGMRLDPVLNEELPLLEGGKMYESTTRNEIIILDFETDKETRLCEGLGCTVMDPIAGIVRPAIVGGRMRDSATGHVVPIARVTRDPATFQIVPESNLRGVHVQGSSIQFNLATLDASQLLDALSQMSNASDGESPEHGMELSQPATFKKTKAVKSSVKKSKRESREGQEKVEDATDSSAYLNIASFMEELSQKLKIISDDLCQKYQPTSFEEVEKIRSAILTNAKSFTEALRDSYNNTLQTHFENVKNKSQKALDEAERQKLLKEFSLQEELLEFVLRSEGSKVLKTYSNMYGEHFERLLHKHLQDVANRENLKRKVENGEATPADDAALKIKEALDTSMIAKVEGVLKENVNALLGKLSQTRKRMVEILGSSAEFDEAMVDSMIDEHERMHDQLDLDGKKALFHQISDIEMKNEEEKNRKITLLRATAPRRQARSLWKKAKGLAPVSARKSSISSTSDSEEVRIEKAKNRHTEQKANLESAHEEYASIAIESYRQEIEMKNRGEIRKLDEFCLQKFEAMGDDEERKRMLESHYNEREKLKNKLEIDKERQLTEFNKKLAERRAQQLQNLDALQKEEMIALKDADHDEHASKMALQADLLVQHLQEETKIEGALWQQQQSEVQDFIRAQTEQEEAQQNLMEMKLLSNIAATDDPDLRQKMLDEHNIAIQKVKLQQGIARNKTEEDIRRRLNERKAKKLSSLGDQHSKAKALVETAIPLEEISSELANLNEISASMLRHEEQKAREYENLLRTAESEIKTLRLELEQRMNSSIEMATNEFKQQMVTSTYSDEDRERLLRNHDEEIRMMKQQMQLDAARQVGNLESMLQNRRQKKKRQMEAIQAKEMKQFGVEGTTKVAEISLDNLDTVYKAKEDKEIAAILDKLSAEEEKLLAESRQQIVEAQQSSDLSDAEREKLVKQHEENLQKLKSYMDIEKQKKTDELKMQIEERKRRKAEKLQERARLQQIEEEIRNKQQAELELLEQTHEKQIETELMQVENELEIEKERENARMMIEMDRKLEEAKQAEMKKIEVVTSDAVERERLLKEADARLDHVKHQAEIEKQKQEKALQEKLALKKAKRASELKRRHDEELSLKMCQQVEEAEKMLSRESQGTSAEYDSGDEGIEGESPDDYENAELHKRLEEERKAFEAEMILISGERERVRKELKEKHEAEKSKIEIEMKKEQEELEKQMRLEQAARMEEFERRKLQMKQEMENASNKMSSAEREILIKQHEERLRNLEQEAMAKKASIDSDLKEKLEQRKLKKKMQAKKGLEQMEGVNEVMLAQETTIKGNFRDNRIQEFKLIFSQGRESEARKLLRDFHSEELQQLQAAQASEIVKAKARGLQGGIESEAVLLEKTHENKILELKTKQEREKSDLEKSVYGNTSTSSLLQADEKPEETANDQLSALQSQIEKMETEYRSKQEMERQKFEQKRAELASRGAQRIRELHEEMMKPIAESASSALQTREDIQREHEEENEALVLAIDDEKHRQHHLLTRRLRERQEARLQSTLDNAKKAGSEMLMKSLGKTTDADPDAANLNAPGGGQRRIRFKPQKTSPSRQLQVVLLCCCFLVSHTLRKSWG